MRPALSQDDFTNGIMTETKISANASHSFAGGMARSYFPYILGSEGFSISAILKRMMSISLGSVPFKIRDNVIGSNKVDMVDLGQIVRIGNKGDSHKAVDHASFGGPIFVGQSNAPIAILVRFWSHDFGWLSAGLGNAAPRISDCSSKTSDAAKTGNFIKLLKSSDRSPFFIDHIASPKACDLAPSSATRYRGRSQPQELAICP